MYVYTHYVHVTMSIKACTSNLSLSLIIVIREIMEITSLNQSYEELRVVRYVLVHVACTCTFVKLYMYVHYGCIQGGKHVHTSRPHTFALYVHVHVYTLHMIGTVHVQNILVHVRVYTTASKTSYPCTICMYVHVHVYTCT